MMNVMNVSGGVQPLEDCRSEPDGTNGDWEPAGGNSLFIFIIIDIIIIIITIIITITIIAIIIKGSTSDAEMLAEAAMLREHRNRLENRMVISSSSF